MRQWQKWEDAPSWARYRTGDWDGQINYWEVKPEPRLPSAWWFPEGVRGQWAHAWSEHGGFWREDWRNTLEERPTQEAQP